ncbi:MAG: SH3 domain-containing protein [Chloroflexota bacterium]|jgi:uncharacterized protein YgiM (DUF1202 family)
MTRLLLTAILTVTLSACLTLPTETAAPTETVTLSPAPSETPTATAAPTACRVIAWTLHVRRGPGIEYVVTAWLSRGETVTVLRSSGGWYETPGGWINSKYCEVKP